MINSKKILLVVIAFFFLGQAWAGDTTRYQIVCTGFYNLENLFDYWDDSTVNDSEYLPDGGKAWDSTKYANKLYNLSRVISELGTDHSPDGLAVIGVSEIENRGVLEDLVAMPLIAKRNYKIVHFDSPDLRGVDVGLLYQEKYFKPKKAVTYPLVIPSAPDSKTRDQLVVTGEIDGEDVTFIVVHWRSRLGGQKASEYKRIAAAELTRHIIDSLQHDNPDAKVIFMGDLNDDPVNVAITDYLRAKGKKEQLRTGDMYNPFWEIYKKGNGTLAYQDSWNLFDQIIFTQPFLSENSSTFVFHQAIIFRRDYMFHTEGNYKGYPKRTFAGGEYLNGYSDHLPTYLVLKKKVN